MMMLRLPTFFRQLSFVLIAIISSLGTYRLDKITPLKNRPKRITSRVLPV